MASYADNRNALFGTSKDAKPKPKPQKRSYTLGGQSKAAQQRQRERAAQLNRHLRRRPRSTRPRRMGGLASLPSVRLYDGFVASGL